MRWQPFFYGTTASGSGHPPTVCRGHNLADLPVSRPTLARSLPAVGPRARARPCQLVESGRDLHLHRATEGSLPERLPEPGCTGRATAGFSVLLGNGSATVRMEIHSPRPRQAAHEARESALETAARDYETVSMKRCTKPAFSELSARNTCGLHSAENLRGVSETACACLRAPGVGKDIGQIESVPMHLRIGDQLARRTHVKRAPLSSATGFTRMPGP